MKVILIYLAALAYGGGILQFLLLLSAMLDKPHEKPNGLAIAVCATTFAMSKLAGSFAKTA